MPDIPHAAVLLTVLLGGCASVRPGTSPSSRVPPPEGLVILAPAPSLPREVAALSGRWEGVSNDGLEVALTVLEVEADHAKVRVESRASPALKLLPHRYTARVQVLTGERLGLEWRMGEQSLLAVAMGPDGQSLEGEHELGRTRARVRLTRREAATVREVRPFTCASVAEVLAEQRAEARRARVEALLERARKEGTPLVEPGSRAGFGCATFLYQGEAREVSLAGDMNGWDTVIDELTRIEGTDVHFLSREFEQDARLDYKLVVDGQEWVLDPNNARTMTGGYGPNSHFWMPGYVAPPEVELHEQMAHGTVESFELASKHEGRSRTVSVYLPPGYASSSESYPVLYLNDGKDALELGRVDRVMDWLAHEGTVPGVIVVLVPPVDRGKEYALDEVFESLFVEEVVPAIDERYRTRREAAYRAIGGISMGGSAALSLALRYPEVFGRCVAQSSGGPDENAYAVLERIRQGPKQGVSFYLDVGTYESNLHGTDLLDYSRSLRDALSARGEELEYQEVHEGHSWGNWRARLDDVLRLFWGRKPLPQEGEPRGSAPSQR